MVEEFRVRYPAAYPNPSHLLAPIALLGVDIPHVQRHTQGHALRNTGRTGGTLAKWTSPYILALARAKASRQ